MAMIEAGGEVLIFTTIRAESPMHSLHGPGPNRLGRRPMRAFPPLSIALPVGTVAGIRTKIHNTMARNAPPLVSHPAAATALVDCILQPPHTPPA